jgi:hypothetical protein
MERRPITFEAEGLNRSVRAGDLIDQAAWASPARWIRAGPSASTTWRTRELPPGDGEGDAHKFHAFGVDWDDKSGTRNGHFAPFAWSG